MLKYIEYNSGCIGDSGVTKEQCHNIEVIVRNGRVEEFH